MSNFSTDRHDSFLGYFFEAPRALYCLVSDASIAKVRIENLDDISLFDYSDNVICLEQIKYKEKFNLTNNSYDLWNTLSIWVKNVNSNPNAYLNTKFQIFSVLGFEIGDFASAIFQKIVDDISFQREWQIIQQNFNTDSENLQHIFDFLNNNQENTKICVHKGIYSIYRGIIYRRF